MCRRKTDPSGTSDLRVRIEMKKLGISQLPQPTVGESGLKLRPTDNIENPEELAEEISVSPEVVVLQVCIQIVDQQLLLLPLLGLGDDALVEVHLER